MEFLNRENELGVLESAWSERPSFIVVYGRRRIGKTRLVREFLSRHSGVYYFCQLSSHSDNLRRLSSVIADYLGYEVFRELEYSSLDKLLSLATRFKEDIVIVFDEFSYWVRVAPRVLSELQYFIDHVLPSTKALVIVVGSIYTIMTRDVLGGSSPLYGRSRYRIHLREFYPWDVKLFIPGYKPVDRIRVYALFGGIPFYLRMVRDDKSLRENIYELVLAPHAPLRYEKDFLLREEFREPHTYNAILSAIARGYNTPSKIADLLGFDRGYIAKCLGVLESLGYVKPVKPLFMKKAIGYKLSDPILRTWYYLVEPIQSLLETESYMEALEYIVERLDQYVSSVYKEVAVNVLSRRFVPKGYRLHGRVVYRGEEIDHVYINPDTRDIIVVEVKWSDLGLRDVRRIMYNLEAKAHRLLRGYSVKEKILVIREYLGREKPSNILTASDLGV